MDLVQCFKKATLNFANSVENYLPMWFDGIVSAANNDFVEAIIVFLILFGIEPTFAHAIDMIEPHGNLLMGHFVQGADIDEQIERLVGDLHDLRGQ